jgi:hypothetical protein
MNTNELSRAYLLGVGRACVKTFNIAFLLGPFGDYPTRRRFAGKKWTLLALKLALPLAFISIELQAATPEAQPDAWLIKGHVLAVLSDGILVACSEDETPGTKKPQAGEVVFVKGKFAFAEKDAVNLDGVAIGTHKYKSSDNPSGTVRAFEIRN